MPENTNSNTGGNTPAQPAGGQQKPTLSWSQPAAAKPAATGSVPPATPVQPLKQTATPKTAPMADNTSNTGTYVGIFVAGLIIGALIGWGVTSNNTNGTSSIATSTDTLEGTATGSTTTQSNTSSGVNLAGSTMDTSGAVVLASSQPAGFAVAVTKATVTQPTWLVVYEDHAGVPGNVIGAGLFFAGTNSGTIELLRATLPGQSYFIGQTLDDGDKIFSLATDKPVRDSQGNPLFTQFTAQ
jgi:hypothetical protein